MSYPSHLNWQPALQWGDQLPNQRAGHDRVNAIVSRPVGWQIMCAEHAIEHRQQSCVVVIGMVGSTMVPVMKSRGGHHIHRVGTGIYQKIDGLCAVMNRMKPPQKGNLVAKPVAPVKTDFTDEQRQHQLDCQRQAGECREQDRRNDFLRSHHQYGQRCSQQN